MKTLKHTYFKRIVCRVDNSKASVELRLSLDAARTSARATLVTSIPGVEAHYESVPIPVIAGFPWTRERIEDGAAGESGQIDVAIGVEVDAIRNL